MNASTSNIKYDYDLIIIGAGPAGMSAAIYAQRANWKTLLIEKALPGGKMTRTAEIENYPGYAFITGQELSVKMQEQVEKLNVKIEYDEVLKIVDGPNHISKTVTLLNDNKQLVAKAVIVATGCLEKKLGFANGENKGIPGEDEYYGKGVSYCGVCDGFLFKDKIISVVGGGYAACEESLFLAKLTNQENLIHRREGFRADKKTVNKTLTHPHIKPYLNYVVIEVLGDGKKVTGLLLQNTITKEIKEIKTDALFPYIGSIPITDFVKDLGVCDQEGYIVVDEIFQTKIPGLFAAGDVVSKKLRQIVTATNDGAIAAQYIINFIDDIN